MMKMNVMAVVMQSCRTDNSQKEGNRQHRKRSVCHGSRTPDKADSGKRIPHKKTYADDMLHPLSIAAF
jgi:hypothetical protein